MNFRTRELQAKMIYSFFYRMKKHLFNLSPMTWILLGFFITFIWFFIGPILFNPSMEMKFNEYIPTMSPIGHDFFDMGNATSAWIHTGNLPAILYPSLTLIFFVPFLLFSYTVGYKIIVAIIIACYLLITFAIPRWINKSKDLSAFAMLIFITGIVSYGFQFELERGQWNIITFAFTVTAIYLFHNQPKYRWLSYLLFTISIQLKLYPAIFIFCFIEDWSDWRENIKRILGLGIVNILTMLVFGLGPVLTTITSLSEIRSSHTGSSINLSITSFTLYILSSGILPRKRIFLWLMDNNWFPQLLLYIFFGFCFLVILWQAYKKNSKGINPHVFLACTIGACVVPSISFDYKLSLLPASILISTPAIFFSNNKNGSLIKLLAFIFSIAYSSTLYSYANKPPILQNNFPALLIMVTIYAIFSLMDSHTEKELIPDATEAESGV